MASSPQVLVRFEIQLPSVPRWAVRDAALAPLADAAFQAGASLSVLDARMRAVMPADPHAEAPTHLPAGVWRRRLALKAAAASSQMIRRSEDEAALRDAFYLRHDNADPGPAGRLLMAWRGLDRGLRPRSLDRELDRSTPRDDDAVLRVAGLFGLEVDAAMKTAIAGVQQIARSKAAAPLAAAQAASLVIAQRGDAELLALWLADAVLAVRLQWSLPLPLLAGAIVHRSLRNNGRRPCPDDESWAASCCAAYALAAREACALFDELHKRSEQLRAVQRRLRAKGAAAVIAKLRDEDAVSPSGRIGTMSDRALRRLFERLVTLGVVRELTGRSTFRLYGL